MATEQDITIVNQRGGMNDTDNPSVLALDEVVSAINVEWFYSTFGERRQGCKAIDLTGSGLTARTTIVHLSQWFPTNEITNPELWAIAANPGNSGSIPLWARRVGTVTGTPTWQPVVPVDPAINSVPEIYEIVSKALNGKLFWAYKSALDRLHVWDGTSFRLAGLAQPDPPTVATEGVGTYSGTRYFRTRLATYAGTVVLRRSEPSTSVAFVPPGTGAGARITRASVTSALDSHSDEGQTHWEVEASLDDATFYRIAVVPIATTTYDDETPFAEGYATDGTPSDAIGSNTLQPSARFLAVDGNRLLGAGHWTDISRQSEVWWTPVANDPGVGSDERLPLVTTGGESVNNTLSLDNFAGGPITGITDAVYGVWYVFKYSRIYKMQRTGDNTRAYEAVTLSVGRGAIPGTIFPGIDENGSTCVYFLDPMFGASRIGVAGIQVIKGLRTTWKRVNLKATNVVARGTFYPYKQQAHWWMSADGANTPTLKQVLQASEVQMDESGSIRRGWSLADGTIARATAVTNYWEWVDDNGTISLSLRPFIGTANPATIQRCDVEATDNGDVYVASIVTRPYIATGILNKFGAMVCSLLATAESTRTVFVRLIRDFGLETTVPSVNQPVSMAPTGAETMVIKKLDDLRISEAYVVQVKISDT